MVNILYGKSRRIPLQAQDARPAIRQEPEKQVLDRDHTRHARRICRYLARSASPPRRRTSQSPARSYKLADHLRPAAVLSHAVEPGERIGHGGYWRSKWTTIGLGASNG